MSRIVLASDHAGYTLKEIIKSYLTEEKGMDVIDVGTFSEDPVDYPAIMRQGCAAALESQCPVLLFGGSGNGEAMAANKVPGIRAAVAYVGGENGTEIAHLARAHNDANALSFGARFIDPESAKAMADVFLETAFDDGRHTKRVRDIEPAV